MDLVYLSAYYFFKFVFFITPKFILTPFLNGIGTLAYHIDNKHRRIAFVNLDLTFKDTKTKEEKEKIVKQLYKNLAFFGYDFIQNQNITREKLLQKVTIENEEIYQKALQSGRPLVFQSAHFGTWELVPLSMAAKFNKPVSVVGRELDSKSINKILEKNRTQFDIEIIDKMAGARPMLKAIKQGRNLGVLVDQDTSTKNEGIEIQFFGCRALQTPALSVLAKKTKALVIPIFVYKTSLYTHKIRILEPIDPLECSIEETTQAQADRIEEMARFKPDEYFWLHRRFKSFYKELYNA